MTRRALYCEEHRDWCHLSPCSKCGTIGHVAEMYFLMSPVQRPEGTQRICTPCFDAMVAAGMVS